MTTLYTVPRELQSEKWTGSNLEEIEVVSQGRGPTPEVGENSSGAQFSLKAYRPGGNPEKVYDLKIWTGQNWVEVPIGWWVTVMDGGSLARMSPDYVARYCTTELRTDIQHYYRAYRAAQNRLERVSLGIEKLALEIATVKGQPNLGRHIQDRIRQLLCTHPESALRYGAAQVWCSICISQVEPTDMKLKSEEVMAHVVAWCKCDTSDCPVHHGANEELPPPTIVVPAIPEARRSPALLPASQLVEFEESPGEI